MKRLTATICLTIAVLLGITGCAQRNVYGPSGVYVFPGRINNVPDCKLRAANTWIDWVNGQQNITCGGSILKTFRNVSEELRGIFKNGKAYGKMRSVRHLDHKITSTCFYTNNENDKKEGWENCKDGNNRFISRKFYVNGVESPQKGAEVQQASYRKNCQEIGFTPKTDRFADCVLRLMEMSSNNRSSRTVIQNNTGDGSAVRALLEEQRNQRQLEGALELMKRGSEMMNPPKPALTCKYNAFTKTTVCN